MKKSNTLVKYLLLTVIMVMSLIGISYASWDDSIGVKAKTSTASIELTIQSISAGTETYDLVVPYAEKDFKATLKKLEGETATGELLLTVKNTGDLPVTISGMKILPEELNSLSISITEDSITGGIWSKDLTYTSFGNWNKNLKITGDVTVETIPPDPLIEMDLFMAEGISEFIEDAGGEFEGLNEENDGVIEEGTGGENLPPDEPGVDSGDETSLPTEDPGAEGGDVTSPPPEASEVEGEGEQLDQPGTEPENEVDPSTGDEGTEEEPVEKDTTPGGTDLPEAEGEPEEVGEADVADEGIDTVTEEPGSTDEGDNP